MEILTTIRKEIKALGLVFVYFLVCFTLASLLEKIVLKNYSISFHGFSKAVILALIVAKAVLVLDRLPFDRGLGPQKLAVDILFRSLVYTAGTSVLFLADKLFPYYRQTDTLAAAFAAFSSQNIHQFWATVIWLALAFILYNVFSALNLYVGQGALAQLFFSTSRQQLIARQEAEES